MSEWHWKIPTILGTKWAHQGLTSNGGLPSLNVYCEGGNKDPHDLYLVGMFEASVSVFEQTGRLWWTFSPSYITGDGHRISLHQQASFYWQRDPTNTYLVDDHVLTDDRERTLADQSKIRIKYDLHCEKCERRKKLRSDNPKIASFVSTLYRAEYKEVSLLAVMDHFSSK